MLAVLLAADTVGFFLIEVRLLFWAAPEDFFFSFFGPGCAFVSIGDKLSVALVALFDPSFSSKGVDVPCCDAWADVPGSSVVAFRLRVACLLGSSCLAVSSSPVGFGL